MNTIFESCTPRKEVLEGELRDDLFAARLKDVMEGTADPIYQNAEIFFDNTFPTAGLKVLLGEALGRLTGLKPASNAVIRLETAFGGGKTHNLIALYHTAKGRAPGGSFVAQALVPAPGYVRVAGVVGSDLQPRDGLRHDEVTTYTIWGELAYQIGGASGYAIVSGSDRDYSAPGTGFLEQLVGDQPTLIMLDEVARHMRSAMTVPTVTGKSDLAEQTVAFLMSLFEFAASKRQVVVVVTLSDPHDAFGQEAEKLRHDLAEARRVSARQERVITPTGETEIAAIVTHRLFASVNREAARETAARYAQYYRQLVEGQGANLPQHALRAEYAEDMVEDYPLHPELLNTLNRKTSTIPNFQKTRGALRLLARVVRNVWMTRPADAHLIHPFHVDLGVEDIAGDLTSRLDRPAFKQVVEADIVSPKPGSPAHAQAFDQPYVAAGKPHYTRRVATTVFLHSLTQGIASGVDQAAMLLAVLAPGDDPVLAHKAAEQLYDKGWFFDWDGRRYRFKTEPSLNKIVSDEMDMIGRTKAKEELDGRIRRVWKSGVLKVLPFPQEASDVDDDAGLPKLAILHYDAATVRATEPAPPELTQKIAQRSGTLEGFRRFRNNVLFLVADQDRVENMVKAAQRYLAIARITGDAERLGEFNQEQRKKLKKMGEAAELDVRVAVTRTYRHLYFPRADALKRDANLAHERLPAQDQGEVEQDQSSVVLRALKLQQKTLTGDSPTLAAAYVRSKAWDKNAVTMTTEDLRKAFARRLSLPLLLDINQLKKTILNGVKNGLWIYYDAPAEMGYDADSPPPAVQITEETHLYAPEEAARLALPIKGKIKSAGPDEEERCPFCGNPASQCTCGDITVTPPAAKALRGDGVPQQAFQQLSDLCHDGDVSRLAWLGIIISAEGKAGARNLRTLGLVIPQLGKGEFTLDQSYTAEFENQQYLTIRGILTWDLYRRLKQVTDELAKEAMKFVTTTTLTIGYEGGLEVGGDQFRTIHEVMTSVGLDSITLEATELAEGETAE